MLHGKDSSWTTVAEDSRGGACEILIEKVKVTSKENVPVKLVQSNDDILLQMIIQVYLPKEKVIFGYLVKDRVGNAVFGENTCICPTGPVPLKA
ncbi:MAG: Wzt carbohydrate-binding domain-containing protein, partial [Deltaproteobacteria bacterium]|nr:Wzt carbohydrate-binding domain-containing protein [Deltaproteobacteria bacterium]